MAVCEDFNPFQLRVNATTLAFSQPLSFRYRYSSINQNGYLSIISENKNISTFSLDVGMNRGKVIYNDWLKVLPHLFVIGIEANHLLVSYHESNEQTKLLHNRAILIPAAVSSSRGISHFNTGSGFRVHMSDVGSLYNWSDSKMEYKRRQHLSQGQQVQSIRLDDILKYVPPPRISRSQFDEGFLWDTLKVDIQGADTDALASSGSYLANFICIVGEFKSDYYNIPANVLQDPIPIFKQFDFKKVYQGEHNQIWINMKYKDIYMSNPTKFGCHLVYDSKVDVSVIIQSIQ